MAAWGYEFYLLVLKVEDKIRIPARPRDPLCVSQPFFGSCRMLPNYLLLKTTIFENGSDTV